MSNLMHYKGLDASVEFSDEDSVFYGKIEGIRSLIAFEGTSISELRKAFKETVDDYLETCESQGIEPEKPYKGSFNVRIGSRLHRKVYLMAKARRTSINKIVKKALERESMGG